MSKHFFNLHRWQNLLVTTVTSHLLLKGHLNSCKVYLYMHSSVSNKPHFPTLFLSAFLLKKALQLSQVSALKL